MAFDVSSGRSGPRKDVNITPLIDVVLVLLIIFMVLSPTTLKHVKPEVAKETTAPVTPPGPAPMLVTLSAAGEVTVNGQQTEWARLPEVVRAGLAQRHQTAVHFKISDDVDYGRAVRLLDLCKGAGAAVLALPPEWRAI